MGLEVLVDVHEQMVEEVDDVLWVGDGYWGEGEEFGENWHVLVDEVQDQGF